MENFFKNVKTKLLIGGLGVGIGMSPLATSAQEAGPSIDTSTTTSKHRENSQEIISEIDTILNGPVESMDSTYKIAVEKLIHSGGVTLENWVIIKQFLDRSPSVKELSVQALLNEEAGLKLQKINNICDLFLKELYKEKSPFAELPGKLHYPLKPGYDLSIKEDDGKKIFNLVLNENFKYQQVDEGSITESDPEGFINTIDPELQMKNESGKVYVRFTLNNGSMETFYANITDREGKSATYHFSVLRTADTPNASYDEFKKVFFSVVEK